jgi:hypothetical protein
VTRHIGFRAFAMGVVGLAAVAAPAFSGSTAAEPRSNGVVIVATTGRAGAAGTLAEPLATVAQALKQLPHGGTVELRGGVYDQRITISGRHDITIEPYHREHVALDGTHLTAPAGASAVVEIVDSTRITVAGLDISGYATLSAAAVPIGIYVHGAGSHITIRDDHVHDLGTYGGVPGNMGFNAHGIAVYGDRSHHPITDITITGNEVDRLSLGASEAVVVNGNVDGWWITHNDVHDDDNIGIDAIGYEQTITGPARYTDADRARHGEIADNTVDDISSADNAAYEQGHSNCDCADGIYVDGGTHIRIERNRVSHNDIGIEVAAENARGQADHVTVADNDVWDSGIAGISTGGYCNGAPDCGGVRTGRSVDNVFVNNTLWNDDTLGAGSPEFLVQYYARDDTIENDIIWAADGEDPLIGTVPGAQRDGFSARLVVDHNLYFTTGGTPATAIFGFLGRTYTGWRHYRLATGLDRHSRFENPDLVDPAGGDLDLRAGSPAIDAGLFLPRAVVGARDVDHHPRTRHATIDVGADEYPG